MCRSTSRWVSSSSRLQQRSLHRFSFRPSRRLSRRTAKPDRFSVRCNHTQPKRTKTRTEIQVVYNCGAVFFAFLTLFGLAQTPNLDALGNVLQKAQAYAARYEDQLGALISTEEYFQTAVWTGIPASSTKGRLASRT